MKIQSARDDANGRFELVDDKGTQLDITHAIMGNAKYAQIAFPSELLEMAETHNITHVSVAYWGQADGSYELDAMVPIEEVNARHNITWQGMMDMIKRTGYNGTPE